VTFSTIKARAAVRDASRVLGYPWGVGDRIAKLMPPLIMGRDTPLRACLEKVTHHEDGYKMAAELRALYDSDPDAKRVIDVARGLEGLRRRDGIHGRRRDHTGAAHQSTSRSSQARPGGESRTPDRHAVRDARRQGTSAC
jgi:hypothetical protein